MPRGRIRLDVIVNDRSGKPVPGLGQQDFTIFDGKQMREIRSFEAVTERTVDREPLEIILVSDSVNVSFSRQASARGEIRRFLMKDDGRLPYPLSIAFLSDKGLSLQAAASRDGRAVAALMDKYEAALRSIRNSQGIYADTERLDLSLRAMQDLARYTATKSGRKIVIFVSPGWPILNDFSRLSATFLKAIFRTIVGLNTQLREANVTLCQADPLGQEGGVAHATTYDRFLKGVRSWQDALTGNVSLQVLALQSGGRVLNSSNDVAAEIDTCMGDANPYYVLSFDPLPADGPDDYHTINVKIAQPRLKAQTRAGYYAQPDAH